MHNQFNKTIKINFFILIFYPITSIATNVIDGTLDSIAILGDFQSVSPNLNKLRWQITEQALTRDDSEKGPRLSENQISGQLGQQFNTNTAIWLGYLHNWSYPLNNHGFHENRTYQDLVLNTELGELNLTARSRLDQRIRADSNETGYRIRQSLVVNYRLSAINKNLSLFFGDELYGYLNNSAFGMTGLSENRAQIGFAFQINNQLTTELGYVADYLYSKTNNDILINNLLFNLRYRI